jgi:hypothetical protein
MIHILKFVIFHQDLFVRWLVQKLENLIEQLKALAQILQRGVESVIDVLEYLLSWKTSLSVLAQSFG